MAGRESGRGGLGLIIFIVILGFGIFFLVKYIPPKIDADEFRNTMGQINTDPDYRMRRLTVEQVQDILYNKAQELNLPIEKKQIDVNKKSELFVITVKFQIPIDLKITTINQKYDFKEPRSL
jgi:hypothetical protein